MKANRLNNTRPESALQTEIADLLAGSANTDVIRIFHLGQVVNSTDPENLNRLKVRIPLLDDPFYLDEKNNLKDGIGDNALPWALPAHDRLISAPEPGSIVLVALFDTQNPLVGRVWFTAIPKMNGKKLEDSTQLQPEYSKDSQWENAEKVLGVNYRNTPGKFANPKIKTLNTKINYEVGMRGKNKNLLLFEKNKTSLIQNKGTSDESKLELTQNVLLSGAKLDLISSKSPRRERPVFADPLIAFIQTQNALLSSIVGVIVSAQTHLNLLTNTPDLPNPAASALQSALSTMLTAFTTFQTQGVSENIKIN